MADKPKSARLAELRKYRDTWADGPNEWLERNPELRAELAALERDEYELYLTLNRPWKNLRESSLSEFVTDHDHESGANSGKILFDGHEVASLREAEHPMWTDLFAASPGMFAALVRLLNSPDLNEDSLSPETIKAIDDANHVLDRVRKGRVGRATWLTAEQKSLKLAQADSVRELLTSLVHGAMLVDDPTQPGTDAYLLPLTDVDAARALLNIH